MRFFCIYFSLLYFVVLGSGGGEMNPCDPGSIGVPGEPVRYVHVAAIYPDIIDN
jgi:hypothetical protein